MKQKLQFLTLTLTLPFLLIFAWSCENLNSIDSTVPATGVTIIADTLLLVPEETSSLTATVSPSSVTISTITWASSDVSIATVDSSGLATAIAVGEATITATTTDGTFTDSCVVTVESVITGILFIDWDDMDLGNAMSVAQNSTEDIYISMTPNEATNTTFTLESSDISVATIIGSSGEYEVLGVSPGSATITATSTVGSLTDTVIVTVTDDTTDPLLDYMMFVDDDTLYVSFSEFINTTDLEDITNYTVVLNPSGVNTSVTVSSVEVLQSTYNSYVFVNLGASPTAGDEVSLTISSSVRDLADNTISTVGDGDGSFDNIATELFAPAHGLIVDTSKISQSAGMITLNAGAVDLTGVFGTNFLMDSVTVYALAEGDIISDETIVAYADINSEGLSVKVDYSEPDSIRTETPSSLYQYLVVTFPNGTYDLLIAATYDVDGLDDGGDDHSTNFGTRVTYTVTTGS